MLAMLQTQPSLLLTLVGILSLLVGSFLNLLIYRLPIILEQEHSSESQEPCQNSQGAPPKTLGLCFPRSHCTHCQHALTWWQNIPLLSYLILRGRCYFCQARISWRYPLVELLTLLASLAVVKTLGPSQPAIYLLILTWALIAAVFIDWQHLLLPDNLILPMLWLGLFANLKQNFTSPTEAILGAIIGYLVLWVIAKLFKLVRGIDGIGHGDFKLLALFGAWLGWQALPLIVLGASGVGSLVGLTLVLLKKHQLSQPIPFGPYLAGAGWLTALFGSQLLSWYWHLGY